jgi:hypothetical protein
MESPSPNGIERSQIQDAESLRTSRVAALRREIEVLESQKSAKEKELGKLEIGPGSLFDAAVRADHPASNPSPKEKIALFLELFGARRDVYAKFWENTHSGQKGYRIVMDQDDASGSFDFG